MINCFAFLRIWINQYFPLIYKEVCELDFWVQNYDLFLKVLCTLHTFSCTLRSKCMFLHLKQAYFAFGLFVTEHFPSY